jgi:hypothetical protein
MAQAPRRDIQHCSGLGSCDKLPRDARSITMGPQYWADSRTRPARDHQALQGSGSTVTTISLRTAPFVNQPGT